MSQSLPPQAEGFLGRNAAQQPVSVQLLAHGYQAMFGKEVFEYWPFLQADGVFLRELKVKSGQNFSADLQAVVDRARSSFSDSVTAHASHPTPGTDRAPLSWQRFLTHLGDLETVVQTQLMSPSADLNLEFEIYRAAVRYRVAASEGWPVQLEWVTLLEGRHDWSRSSTYLRMLYLDIAVWAGTRLCGVQTERDEALAMAQELRNLPLRIQSTEDLRTQLLGCRAFLTLAGVPHWSLPDRQRILTFGLRLARGLKGKSDVEELACRDALIQILRLQVELHCEASAWGDAQTILKELRALDPFDPNFFLDEARGWALQGKPVEQSKALEQAYLQGPPGRVTAALQAADLAKTAKNLKDQESWLRKAQVADPEAVQPWMGLLELFEGQGRAAEAKALAQEVFASEALLVKLPADQFDRIQKLSES